MLLLENSTTCLLAAGSHPRGSARPRDVDTNARYVADELAHGLRLTGAVGAITHEHLVPRLEESGVPLGWVGVTVDETEWTCDALSSGDPARRCRARRRSRRAALRAVHVGTTSRPKAVLYTHANALWGGKVGADHGRFTATT